MSFWTGKRVVLTGGAGFLGSFVAQRFAQKGCADVIIPRSATCDLREVTAIRTLLREHRPDVVVHLAARVGGIGANQRHPAEFFYDNLMMGSQLMHESWKAGVSKFVAAGTVCAYPHSAPVPFRESDLWNGYPEPTNAPYGLAKKMLLVQAQAYRQQYGFNAIFLLPVNLYGPRDNFDPTSSHVIPAVIRKCFEAQDAGTPHVTIWGTGKATREFLYVEDAADAVVLAAERYDHPDPLNIGAGQEISIADLVQMIARFTGFRGEVRWDPTKPDGQPRRALDVTRAREAIGFVARTPLAAGLEQTIEWYRKSRTVHLPRQQSTGHP